MSTNPYEATDVSGSPYDPPEPVVNKPVSIVVFGVLNVLFGSLGVFGLVTSMIFLMSAFNAQGQNSLWDTIWNGTNPQAAISIVSTILGIIFSVVQLFAGIGLLRRRKSGRTLSTVYAWYAIISAISIMIISYVTMPQHNSAGTLMVVMGMIASTVGSLIFPVLLLIFMHRRNVVAALH